MRCARQADPCNRLILLVCVVIFTMLTGGMSPVLAQGAGKSAEKVGDKLDVLESQLSEQKKQEEFLSRKSRELWTEEQALQSEAISVARRTQRLESELTSLEDQLIDLENREKDAATSLEDKAGQYARILMALQRLSTTPPEALIALPRSPQETLRSAILLKAALPGVEQHARDLKAELGGITVLRAEIIARRGELGDVTTELQQERLALANLLADKRRLRSETEEEARLAARAVDQLAKEANTLTDLLESLQRRAEGLPEPRSKPEIALARRSQQTEDDTGSQQVALSSPSPSPSPSRPAATPPEKSQKNQNDDEDVSVGASITLSRGHLRMPAAGKIVTLFGQRAQRPDGLSATHSKGIEISTRENAQVVSPFDGKVVFAGPFRGYGRLLIIEHGEGYHSLVAGFERLDSIAGQYLLAGEPVGIMGTSRPKLYLEIRQNGEAINPLPWLASQNGKVSG